MAGDWVKMRHDLPDDPAVIAIAELLGVEEDLVVGKLHRFWTWADRQTTDGNAGGVTKNWIDRYLSRPGMADAMVEVGWLGITATGISVPKFEEHISESAKSRALTARRVAKSKSKKAVQEGNGVSVTKALPRGRGKRETSFPSVRDETKGRDEAAREICWDEVLDDARLLAPRVKLPSSPQNRGLILKAAALARYRLTQDWIEQAIEALDAGSPKKNRAAYWHRCLENKAKDLGADFKRLLAEIRIPPEILERKPPTTESEAA